MSTAKENRIKTVLSGKIPDSIPFFPTIYVDHACVACGARFEDALIDPHLTGKYMLQAALKYRSDAVRLVLGPDAAWYETKEVREDRGRLWQYDRRSGKSEGYYDVEGGGKFQPLESSFHMRYISDLDRCPVVTTEEYEQRGAMDDVRTYASEAHEKSLFVVGMCAGQTLNFMVEHLRSAEAALLCFHDDPRLALALIDKAVAISVEKGRAFVRAGVDCLYIGDSYTSGSVISPDIYRKFCAPAYREVSQEFHRQGVFCYKHCCGNYNPFLEDLKNLGLDAMDGIDPTSGMSVQKTKEIIGDALTLMGGISCLTLWQGTTEEVYAEASRCIEAGKPGGRYVLGSACAIPRYTPAANLHAARKARDDFGVYFNGR